MTERVVQKIENIRQKPEHIRLQYALGAVALCMVFVIGVWILTIRQGFFGVSSEMNRTKGQAEETLDAARQSFPTTDSLRTLKENNDSLRLNNNGSADQFIQNELERRPVDPSAGMPETEYQP